MCHLPRSLSPPKRCGPQVISLHVGGRLTALLQYRRSTQKRQKKHQRFGLRSGKGIAACILAISAARAVASSLGGGGPDSLLARAFKTCGGMVPALIGSGSKPPAFSTVLHSCGSFAIVGDLRGLLAATDGCKAPAIAANLSFSYQLVSPSPQPSSLLRGF